MVYDKSNLNKAVKIDHIFVFDKKFYTKIILKIKVNKSGLFGHSKHY